MRKILYSAIVILSYCLPASAQHNFGVATSDWNASNALYLNPANIADCREKFTIDIISANVAVDNNLGRISSLGNLVNAGNGGNTDNLFTYSNNGSFSLLAPVGEIRGPGFMLNIRHKHTVALTTRIRGFNQFNNFDNSLYRTLSDPTYTYTGSATGDINLTSKKFNYTAHLWSEVGLSYGVSLVNEGENEVKIGFTVRYLGASDM